MKTCQELKSAKIAPGGSYEKNELRKMISATSYAEIAVQTFCLRRGKKCLGMDRKPSHMDKRLMGHICINSPSKSGEHFPDIC